MASFSVAVGHFFDGSVVLSVVRSSPVPVQPFSETNCVYCVDESVFSYSWAFRSQPVHVAV